eukprot:2272943-Alexandrium_andersonii.AAC.1
MVGIGKKTPLLVMSLYGWASDTGEMSRHQRTSELVGAAIAELLEWPNMPTIVAADLNARIEQLPSLQAQILAGNWHDLGAIASSWGAEDASPTAWAHNAKSPSRIDYLFADSRALGLAVGWEHGGFGRFDVHAPLSVKLTGGAPCPRRVFRTPQPIELERTQDAATGTAKQIGECIDASIGAVA